jgi:hypothetical protein
MGSAWLDVILKAPLILVILAVWWAFRHQPEDPSAPEDDGGIRRSGDRPHPLRPFPRPPRRGPHGDPPIPSPPRVRSVRARARTYGH